MPLSGLLKLSILFSVGFALILLSFGSGWLLGYIIPWTSPTLEMAAIPSPPSEIAPPAQNDSPNSPASFAGSIAEALPKSKSARNSFAASSPRPVRAAIFPPPLPRQHPKRGAPQPLPPPTTIHTDHRGDWLRIPKLNATAPVKVAPSLSDRDIIRTAREGVVLYPNGVSPGEAGRIFIAGHSTYWKGKYKFIFRKLNQLTLGDLIHLDWKGQRYTYQVRAKTTVNPRRQKMIPADTDLATLALITCTPLWTTKKRLVVYATLVRVDKLALTPLP